MIVFLGNSANERVILGTAYNLRLREIDGGANSKMGLNG
jgi:hypothetical protein